VANKAEALAKKKNLEDLQKQEDQDKLKEGVEVLKHAALSFHPQDDGDLTGTKLIQHT